MLAPRSSVENVRERERERSCGNRMAVGVRSVLKVSLYLYAVVMEFIGYYT